MFAYMLSVRSSWNVYVVENCSIVFLDRSASTVRTYVRSDSFAFTTFDAYYLHTFTCEIFHTSPNTKRIGVYENCAKKYRKADSTNMYPTCGYPMQLSLRSHFLAILPVLSQFRNTFATDTSATLLTVTYVASNRLSFSILSKRDPQLQHLAYRCVRRK